MINFVAFFSYFWGWLSDKIGNRIALILGSVLMAITTFMFGFSFNFYWALTTRFFQGLVNCEYRQCNRLISLVNILLPFSQCFFFVFM